MSENQLFEYCEATVAADPECRGWHEAGHPFHGCHLDPGHGSYKGVKRRTNHVCKCGLEWVSYRRRGRPE